MSFPSHFLPFLLLLTIISPSTSILTTTSLPLSTLHPTPFANPFQKLTHLASTSIARAHHLKNYQNTPTSTTPLSPFNGAYSISLSFGTPPQYIPLILDTGSSFSWFPCTKRYVCKNCSSSSSSSSSSSLSTGISLYIPKQSSSAKILGCMNPKCSWVHKSFDANSSCQDCRSTKSNCNQLCPPYLILYGLGSTGGVAMVETLNLPEKKIENFLVGCSIFSSNQPAGVAGFGRGISSIPSQLSLKKFSYCLVSHKFDNTPKSSFLQMDSESDSDRKMVNFSYTPMVKNPVGKENTALSEYYYLGLRKVTVGGKKIKIPYEYMSSDLSGNGGTIVDSGSTFTYMNKNVFNLVADAFSEQVKGYKRVDNVEAETGLRPCFDVTGHENVQMPELKLHFKGGAEMVFPLENYFIADGDGGRVVVCLTMVTDDTLLGPELESGPAIILGNFLMQNFRVEYDLRNERFGFYRQSCS